MQTFILLSLLSASSLAVPVAQVGGSPYAPSYGQQQQTPTADNACTDVYCQVPSASTPQPTQVGTGSRGTAPPSSSPTAGGSSGSRGSSRGVSFGKGVVYSPYQSGGGCKGSSEVARDIQQLSSYDTIRLVGTDCSGVENVLPALASHQRVMLGIFELSQVSSSLTVIKNACATYFDKIHSVTVGNEAVFKGQSSSQVTGAIQQVRSELQSAGYDIPVATVEAQHVLNRNKNLGEASDFVAVNAHPFFNGGVSASQAGSWLSTELSILRSSFPGKEIVITETGWPHQGNSNGAAVPSRSNQQAAISSISSAAGSNCIFLSAFDDQWKSPGPYAVEQYFGLY